MSYSTNERRRLHRRETLQLLGTAALLPVLSCGSGSKRARRHASLWFTYGGRNREVLERMVARFNMNQNQFTIDAVFQGDYFEGLAKLRTALAANVAPTLTHVIGEVVPYLERAGVLLNLAQFDGSQSLGTVPELDQVGSWENGDQYPLVALPFNRSTPIAYINHELFAEARLSAPKTWTDLREVAKALTVKRSTRTTRHGFGCPISWWFWVALVGQAGGRLIAPDGKVVLGGNAGTEAIKLWQDMVHKDGSMKPPPGRDYNAWEQTNQDFLAGRTAMIWTSTAFLRYLEQNAPFRVIAAPLPMQVRHAVPTGGTHWIMPRGSDRDSRLAAWEFLRFMHQPLQAIEWATSTGYLPVTKQAVARLQTEGYYRKHPNDAVALAQLKVAMPWPWSPNLFRIQREIVQPRLERAVLTRLNARELLSEGRRLASEDGA